MSDSDLFLVVHLCFGFLKMDVNLNLAGSADLDEMDTSGASLKTASQDNIKHGGKYIF